jgi:hypothetical protein
MRDREIRRKRQMGKQRWRKLGDKQKCETLK